MTNLRADKVAGAARDIPDLELSQGSIGDDVLVIGWGSTKGSIRQAVARLRAQGKSVAQTHLHHIHPMPSNTGELLREFSTVLVPEMNTGMLVKMLRSEFLVDAKGLNKVQASHSKSASSWT